MELNYAMKCFIVTCDTSYCRKPTENEKRRSMFRPQNEEMVQAWNKVISRKGRELKKTDAVCELHFREEEIDRERVIYKRGGIVERVPRKIPLLNPGVVPSIFTEPVDRSTYSTNLEEQVLLKQKEIYEEIQKQSQSSHENEIVNDCELEEFAMTVEVSSSDIEEQERNF